MLLQFNIPVKPDKIQLYTMDGFAMEQMLCRLYLLFPKIEKHEICRLFKMYNADTWRTIDTLLYSEMTRITNINKYLRLKRMPPPKKPRGQCARTYVTRPLRKSYNWRNIISGTVYNVQPKDSPVPQVKRVLNHYSGYLCAERFRNLVPNVTFDSNGINSIVFETLQPEGGGAGGGKADVENKSTCLPRKHGNVVLSKLNKYSSYIYNYTLFQKWKVSFWITLDQ